MSIRSRIGLGAVSVIVVACSAGSGHPPVFVDGRGVVAVGDSILAFTTGAPAAVLVVNRHQRTVDTLGLGVLTSPVHLQRANEGWYVSDVTDTGPAIAVLDDTGALIRTIDVTDVSPTAHQFAVLPDARVVVIGRGQRLVHVAEHGADTFALADTGSRPSLLLGALGGVLHAVPGQHITLYNGFGNIRWRVDWPWAETAYITDLALDANGRIHVLAGVVRDADEFITYSMVPQTGEVVRWSLASRANTFVVSTFGEVTADTTARWLPR